MDKIHREMEALKGGRLNAHNKTHNEALSHIYHSHFRLKIKKNLKNKKEMLFSIFAAGIKSRTAGKFPSDLSRQ